MKKFNIYNIWELSEDISAINLIYDDEDEEHPLSYIEIIKESTNYISTIDSCVLDVESFPECPDDAANLTVLRPSRNMKKYIGKYCAFYNTYFAKKTCNFDFRILLKVEMDMICPYISKNETENSKANVDMAYKYCIPAEEALELIEEKINDETKE